MPIPALNELGYLPLGVYDCTMGEVRERFGSFQESDRRVILWRQLREYLAAAEATNVVEELLLDGSFVTDISDPNDIDLIVVVGANHDFGADLLISAYNILAQNRVRRRFGLDIVVVKQGSEDLVDAIAFFQQVRQQPGSKKGLLRLKL